MVKAYINGIGCISSQRTFDTRFGEGFELNEQDTLLHVKPPQYKEYISPVALRRMGNGVKNAIVAATLAMQEAGNDKPDAIITGTGLGCIEDTNRFLKDMLDNHEEYLTPMCFIQSTHNTSGAKIAVELQCKSYNVTHGNGAVSFESALLEAAMMLEEGEAASVLTGGVEELSEHTMALYRLAGFIKEDNRGPYPVLRSATPGVACSEGAVFFAIENKIKGATYARLNDVRVINRIEKNEVADAAIKFLKDNDMQAAGVDAVMLGYNGDVEFDTFYNELANGLFADKAQLYYKHLSGEYNTASAFGLWAGANIIKHRHVPEILKANKSDSPQYENILLYNQYRGIDHSFTLISKC